MKTGSSSDLNFTNTWKEQDAISPGDSFTFSGDTGDNITLVHTPSSNVFARITLD